MTGVARTICAILAIGIAGAGCSRADVGDNGPGAVSSDTAAAADTGDTSDATGTADASAEGWQTDSGISYRRERALDLTGDGQPETVIASAAGPAYDSLDIAITIEGQRGDTLWHEGWPSLLYFKYDPLEGKADTTVARIVRDHVDLLLETDRFTMGGGLPAALRRGGDPDATMREAVHYHLAELDYRAGAGLTPVDATPPEGYSSINADDVATTRVDAVLEEVKASPSFMYYAGGEATYVLAWSEREGALVRIYSCC